MRLEASPLRPGAFQGMSIIQRVILPCLPKFYLLEEHFSLLPVVQGRAQFFFFFEREIKFIRVGDADRTVGQLKGEPTLNRGT